MVLTKDRLGDKHGEGQKLGEPNQTHAVWD